MTGPAGCVMGGVEAGQINAESFRLSVDRVLVPTLRPGDIVRDTIEINGINEISDGEAPGERFPAF